MNLQFFLFTLLIVGAIVVFMILASRYNARELQHKEMIAALEKGVDLLLPQTQPWTPRTYLLRGMVWLFAGLASMVALFAVAATSGEPVPLQAKLSAVRDARAQGATPEEVQMILNDRGSEQHRPVGIALLGLIPSGVGLAYLIFYRIESKKLLS
jgi:hypothetical protein